MAGRVTLIPCIVKTCGDKKCCFILITDIQHHKLETVSFFHMYISPCSIRGHSHDPNQSARPASPSYPIQTQITTLLALSFPLGHSPFLSQPVTFSATLFHPIFNFKQTLPFFHPPANSLFFQLISTEKQKYPLY
jgi:hypothetical protein